MPKVISQHTATLEKETPGTVRYSYTNENGRKETQYVLKSVLPTPYPQAIEVVLQIPDA